MPEYWLVSADPTHHVHVRLDPPGPLTAGRSAQSAVVLPDESRTVSRTHAILEWVQHGDDGAWRLISTASTGSTWVNGAKMRGGTGLTLRHGDLVRIGPYRLRYVCLGAAGTIVVPLDGDGSHDTEALTLAEPATFAREQLLLLVRTSDRIHRAADAHSLRQVLIEAVAEATQFENVAVLRTLDDGSAEVLASLSASGAPARYSRTMLKRAQAGPVMVSDIRDAAGSTLGASLHRMQVEQAVCMPLDAGGSVHGFLYLDTAHRRDPSVLSTMAGVAAALGRLAAHALASLERTAMEQRFAVEQQLMFAGTVHALISAIDAKDPYTRGHSDRVAAFARLLAETAGLPEDLIARCYLCGIVHDLGKIGVPEAVLCKPGRLTDDEFELIRRHPEIGHRILRDIPHLQEVLPGVLEHHERWDGSGYPNRLAGEAISLLGRVVCIADCFDAMTSARVYRPARPVDEVVDEIERCAGTHFDPALARAFATIPRERLQALIADPVRE